MNKKTRVSLLVFTIVAALAAFGALWYTRPGTSSYVLDEAKARQNMPLLEVQEPAKQSSPVEINLDYNVITAKVKESLVEDDGFSNVLAKSVSSTAATLVDDKIDTFRDEIDTKLSKQSVDLLASLESNITNNNQELKNLIEEDDVYQSQIDSINYKINNMDDNIELYAAAVNNPDNYSVDITQYIPQLVEAILPEVNKNVLESVDDNKEVLFGHIYSEAEVNGSVLSDAQFEAIYARYRESIVTDITNEVLADIETQIFKDLELTVVEPVKEVVNTVVPVKPTFNTPVKVPSKPTFNTPVKVPSKPTFITTVKVPEAPTFSKSPSYDNSEKYIKTNTINIVATVDGSSSQTGDKDLSNFVSVPSFSSTPVVTVMDSAEYDAQRLEIRDDSIADILEMIE